MVHGLSGAGQTKCICVYIAASQLGVAGKLQVLHMMASAEAGQLRDFGCREWLAGKV